MGWSYESGKYHEPGTERVDEGLLSYGAKLYLTEAEQWLPDSSLILTGITPTSGESNDSDYLVEYACGWEWGEGWEFDGGLRWISLAEAEDHFTEWAPSVVLKAPLGCRQLNAHVEYFTQLSVDREEDYQRHYAGPGLHYLLTPNIEIGTRVFWGMSEDSANFVANSGIGVRF